MSHLGGIFHLHIPTVQRWPDNSFLLLRPLHLIPNWWMRQGSVVLECPDVNVPYATPSKGRLKARASHRIWRFHQNEESSSTTAQIFQHKWGSVLSSFPHSTLQALLFQVCKNLLQSVTLEGSQLAAITESRENRGRIRVDGGGSKCHRSVVFCQFKDGYRFNLAPEKGSGRREWKTRRQKSVLFYQSWQLLNQLIFLKEGFPELPLVDL